MWKNIDINSNLIKFENGKSVLIGMPHKSNYDGFTFWHPAKLVRNSFKRKDLVNLGYTEEFTFKLTRKGRSGNVLDEVTLTAEQLEKEFGVVCKNAKAPLKKENVLHVPEDKDPVDSVVDEDLLDD